MSGNGDCFEVAARLVLDGGEELALCHGMVTAPEYSEGEDRDRPGRAYPGTRHEHAWVERKYTVELEEGRFIQFVTCLDRSNGHDEELPRDLYYRLGGIEEGQVRRYTRAAAAHWMVGTGHYGPWEELR